MVVGAVVVVVVVDDCSLDVGVVGLLELDDPLSPHPAASIASASVTKIRRMVPSPWRDHLSPPAPNLQGPLAGSAEPAFRPSEMPSVGGWVDALTGVGCFEQQPVPERAVGLGPLQAAA